MQLSRNQELLRFVLNKKVMQVLSEGHYVANVVDGKVNLYGKR
jgi:hypothetical protein